MACCFDPLPYYFCWPSLRRCLCNLDVRTGNRQSAPHHQASSRWFPGTQGKERPSLLWISLWCLGGDQFRFFWRSCWSSHSHKMHVTFILAVGFKKASDIDQASLVAGSSVKGHGRLKATAMIKQKEGKHVFVSRVRCVPGSMCLQLFGQLFASLLQVCLQLIETFWATFLQLFFWQQ